MFDLVVKYAAPLKHVPPLPHVFDALLKIWSLLSNRNLLDYLDELEREVLLWKGTSIVIHKYGGTQFNYHGKELGHIHGNGLLDVLFNRKVKAELIQKYTLNEHHIFKDSGWISFKIKNPEDKQIAIELLRLAYVSKSLTPAPLPEERGGILLDDR